MNKVALISGLAWVIALELAIVVGIATYASGGPSVLWQAAAGIAAGLVILMLPFVLLSAVGYIFGCGCGDVDPCPDCFVQAIK